MYMYICIYVHIFIYLYIYLFWFFSQYQPNGKIVTKCQLNSTSITNYNFVISK